MTITENLIANVIVGPRYTRATLADAAFDFSTEEARVLAVDHYFLNAEGEPCAKVTLRFNDNSIGMALRNLDEINIDLDTEPMTWHKLFHSLLSPHERSSLVEFLEFYGIDIDTAYEPTEFDVWTVWLSHSERTEIA